MREIKFRAFGHPVHQGMVYMNPATDDFSPEDLVSTDRWQVMLYTGQKDANGREIYEGDIVRLPMVDNGKGDIATFEFRAPNYFVKGKKGNYEIGETQDPNCYEVIGNIYENGELLREGRGMKTDSALFICCMCERKVTIKTDADLLEDRTVIYCPFCGNDSYFEEWEEE